MYMCLCCTQDLRRMVRICILGTSVSSNFRTSVHPRAASRAHSPRLIFLRSFISQGRYQESGSLDDWRLKRSLNPAKRSLSTTQRRIAQPRPGNLPFQSQIRSTRSLARFILSDGTKGTTTVISVIILDITIDIGPMAIS